jgi:hypothetical protein
MQIEDLANYLINNKEEFNKLDDENKRNLLG